MPVHCQGKKNFLKITAHLKIKFKSKTVKNGISPRSIKKSWNTNFPL